MLKHKCTDGLQNSTYFSLPPSGFNPNLNLTLTQALPPTTILGGFLETVPGRALLGFLETVADPGARLREGRYDADAI